MGATFYSRAVVGVEVDYDRFFINEIVNWHEVQVPVPGLAVNKYGEVLGIGAYTFFHSTDNNQTVLGLGVESGGRSYGKDLAFMELPYDLNDVRVELQAELRNLGLQELWDPDRFGLYAIQYCSY